MTSIETCMNLADALTEATAKVKDARQALLEVTGKKIAAKERLQDQHTYLFNEGLVKGSNPEAREASRRQQTVALREDLLQAEREERVAILTLELAKDERRNLENLLRIEELAE